MLNRSLESLTADISSTDLFAQMFDNFPDGVMALNRDTVLVYYNRAQGVIDDLEPAEAIGKTILDLYRINDNSNYPTLRCLFTRRPLLNYVCYYLTHLGKLINSVHNVFPLFSGYRLTGCICFIQEYGKVISRYAKAEVAAQKNAYYPHKDTSQVSPREIVTRNPAMLQCLDIISRAASSPSPIMLYGETGTGKEMFAQCAHYTSRYNQKPFQALNCAAIPENLLEGMLFGTVKGAFTGSLDKPGLLELTDGGVIFLDEINSMPLGLQSKLLRVIQEQKIRRVGASKEREISLKIISSCNTHPHKAVMKGELRSDLLFRLGVVIVEIPPLRARRGDIPILVKHLITKFNCRLNKEVETISPAVEQAFALHHWPGNVRELEHALEGAMNIADKNTAVLEPAHFKSSLFGEIMTGQGWQEPEPRYFAGDNEKQAAGEAGKLIKAIEAAGGNAAKAARSLNISPQLMNYKMKKYGLKKKATPGR